MFMKCLQNSINRLLFIFLFSLYVICYLAFMLYAIYDYSPVSDTQNHGVPLFTLYSLYKTDENINYERD